MSLLVFNIRSASGSRVGALHRHCKHRDPDGWSEIDPARSHLNRVLHGDPEGVSPSLDAWYKRTGAKRPAKQADSPYVTLVLGASPEYFERGPHALDAFVETAMDWLRQEAGDDLVYADLHLDERTPHLSVLVAPTYEKKKRTPGRKKRGETDEEFAARREAARTAPGTRTVGRSSTEWAKPGSYQRLRQSLADAVAPLGIEYGDPESDATPRDRREWVKAKEKELAAREAALAKAEARAEARDAGVREKAGALRRMYQAVKEREAAAEAMGKEFYRLKDQARQVLNTLSDGLRGLRRAMPMASLRPRARDAVETSLDGWETTLKRAGADLKSASEAADKTLDRANQPEPEATGPKI